MSLIQKYNLNFYLKISFLMSFIQKYNLNFYLKISFLKSLINNFKLINLFNQVFSTGIYSQILFCIRTCKAAFCT